MAKLMKFAAWGLGGLVGLVVLVIVGVWVISDQKLNQKFTAPDDALVHSSDPEILAAGERLATITGCNGCHGAGMQGGLFAEFPDGTQLFAPNIPHIASGYSDADLTKVIRYGVKKSGKPVVIMPSEVLFSMTDADLVSILSYIRATPDEGNAVGKTKLGPLIRFLLVKGDFNTAPSQIADMNTRPVHDFKNEIGRGAYLATIACAECHGLDFKGQSFDSDFAPPDLTVASAYTPEEFATLMKTGVASGGRKLGLMEEVSLGRLSHFTDEEIADIYAFLRDRAMSLQ